MASSALLVFFFAAVSAVQAVVLVNVTQTSQAGDRWSSKGMFPMQPVAAAPASGNVLTVRTSQPLQTIFGFGGAFTESTAFNFDKLTAAQQDFLLEAYFGPTGLRYSTGRLTMGSSDFALGYYSYAEVKDDVNLVNFTIDHDRKSILPLVKRAINASVHPLQMVASPWSAPGWMKTNGVMSGFPGFKCELKAEHYSTFALYVSKYLSAYKAEGVNIWAITVLNEPGCNMLYEGMSMEPPQQAQFLASNLGPQLRADHPTTKIFIYDHNKKDMINWAKPILDDPAARKYSDGVAYHWYDGPFFDHVGEMKALYPDQLLLSTEATRPQQTPMTYNKPDYSHGEFYGNEIWGDLTNWTIGFIDWNLLLNGHGAPDHADPTGGHCEVIPCGSNAMFIHQNGVLYPQAFYWYMGHFSRFVPPGSVHVDTLSNTNDLLAIAFTRTAGAELGTTLTADGGVRVPRDPHAAATAATEVVVVVQNARDAPASFTLYDESAKTAGSYQIPAHSIQSLVYPMSARPVSFQV